MTLLKKILAVVLYLGMAVIAYTGARMGGFFGFLIVALIPLGFFTHILMENAKHEKALKERTARAEREAEQLNTIRQQKGQERKEHDGRHEILWQAPPASLPHDEAARRG